VHKSDNQQRQCAAQVVAKMLGQLDIKEAWLENPRNIDVQEV